MISKNNGLYGYPDMGRTGLSHSLLAWGRCAVWCRDTGATMLAPRWLRLRIGPYLRGERDKRNYYLLFNKGNYLSEPQRSFLLLTANRLYAELDLPEAGFTPQRSTVVVFRNAIVSNEKKMFHLITAEGEFLREQLISMTHRKRLPPPVAKPFVAVHVRMGDFGAANDQQLRSGRNNMRIPIDWYVRVVRKLQTTLGPEVPVVVFSDGSDADLAPLLISPNVTRSLRQPSITDLLQIAQASLLVASGSGFSLWGSFLGSVPRLCYPGQSAAQCVKTVELEVFNDGESDLPAEVFGKFHKTDVMCCQ